MLYEVITDPAYLVGILVIGVIGGFTEITVDEFDEEIGLVVVTPVQRRLALADVSEVVVKLLSLLGGERVEMLVKVVVEFSYNFV